MGQQQLLLLVLGLVLVGIAVVVGIQTFGENQRRANADGLTNDVVRIASDAQAWNLKPKASHGGDGTFGTDAATGVSLPTLGYTLGENKAVPTAHGNLNGAFSITWINASKITIVGCDKANSNKVTAVVTGTSPAQIATSVTTDATCANQI